MRTFAYVRNASMLDLGGPAWLDYDRFDVMAKIPSPPLKSMLEVLLADRFKLTLHKDTKPVALRPTDN